jgi:DNA-binding beta-propeller fold protein YncE
VPQRYLVVAMLLGMSALAAACGGGSNGRSSTTTTTPGALKPTKTYPGPAGLTAGTQPQPNGYAWLLARPPSGGANLQELNLTSGSIGQIVPETAGANSITQSPAGVVGVGVGTATTGALELRNGTSGALVASVPIGAPVRGVVAGADGSTFYVLNGTTSSVSVTLVNAQTDKVSISIPVPLNTVAIAVDSLGQHLYALGSSGTLDVIAVGSGTVSSSFAVGSNPVELALSTSGTTIYVLRNPGSLSEVSVINAATQSQTKVLPAPADCVGIEVSSDGQSLYDFVGTAKHGNIQVFPLAS